MELIDSPMRVKYWVPAEDRVVDCGYYQFPEDAHPLEWLVASLTRWNPDLIFFLVAETTDVFEKEWDFNQTPVSVGLLDPEAVEFMRGPHYESIFIKPEKEDGV